MFWGGAAVAIEYSAPVLVEFSVHPDVLLSFEELRTQAIRKANVRPHHVIGIELVRKAIDARRGRVRIHVVVNVMMMGDQPTATVSEPVELKPLVGEPKVAIVGAGPAGMFCAWGLARRGIRSVVFERGKQVRARRLDLVALTRRGELNPESNYCYGEGGAGTFSDGKLYTRSSKRGDANTVLAALISYGAAPQIKVDARPHIGTNKLPGVVTRMREHLEHAGVRFAFESRVDKLNVRDGRVCGIELASGDTLGVEAVVLAPGHSAHDVHRWVAAAGAAVTRKSFAIGVRVEHAQSFVDNAQYGPLAGHAALGAANYRLVEQCQGVGVFSFCMCPGGFMAPAATRSGRQVVNGWSPSSRSGQFANSGFVAEVGPELLLAQGLDPADPFSGAEFQDRIEQAAYTAGGGAYVAPAQRIGDFVEGRDSNDLPTCSYPCGVAPARLDDVLGPLGAPLREALRNANRKIPGFASNDAIAVGVESRTSSPLRIERDPKTLQSPSLPGLFPCGEGAGFAGGIMSAALDGLRIAGAV